MKVLSVHVLSHFCGNDHQRNLGWSPLLEITGNNHRATTGNRDYVPQEIEATSQAKVFFRLTMKINKIADPQLGKMLSSKYSAIYNDKHQRLGINEAQRLKDPM